MGFNLKSFCVFMAFAFMLVNPTNVSALQLNYTLSAGLGYSDNITRTATELISGSTRRLGALAFLNHESESVSFNFAPRIEYYNFTNEQLEDNTLYYLDSSLTWNIIKSRLFWTFADYVSQSSINITAPDTPFNQQTSNVFLTGPDINLIVGNGKHIELLARYAEFKYEVTDNTDNERYGGIIRFINEINPLTKFSLNIDGADVRYKDEILNENYKRYDGFLGINRKTNQYDFNLDIGYTSLQREVSDNINGLLANLDLNIILNSISNIIVLGHSEYTDSSRNFLLSRALPGELRRFNAAISSDIFYENYIFGLYQWNDNVNTFNIELSSADQDYDEETLNDFDRKIKVASIIYQRRATNLTDIYVRTQWTNTYYRTSFITDDDNLHSVGVNHRLSRSLYLRADYAFAKRNSTDITRNYVENSIFLGIEIRR
jgi:hypothetical protein